MGIVEDAHKIATGTLDLTKRFLRLQGAFARRRAELHHKAHGDWDAAKLSFQLIAEMNLVRAYIFVKEPLINGTETVTPPHLDLKDAARIKTGYDQKLVDAKEQEYRTNRREWVEQIVWRAVAIHPALWKTTVPTPSLQTGALDEILDRRLRAVEQLHCNVNSGGVEVSPANRTWKVTHGGPWEDGHRVRSFEYPFVPKDPFKNELQNQSQWLDTGTMYFFQGIRVPKRVQTVWRDGNPWVIYHADPSLSHQDVFSKMFAPPRESFFNRSWFFCDMVGSAVTLEAAELAIQRRAGRQGDLDAPMGKADYVMLGPVLRRPGQKNRGLLMSDDSDSFFENDSIPLDDLQVGDFVCFWNNRIYDLLENGAWRNEFSHVMGIDANGFGGNIRDLSDGLQIWLAGHGLVTMQYNAMARDLADRTFTLLKDLRKRLTDALAAGNPAPSPHKGRLVSWAPYESFDPPGPWWIEIPKTVWAGEWFFNTPAEVVAAVPRTVTREAGGSGYTPPPQADAVYFPLFEPAVSQTDTDGDSWRAYLRKRKADKTFRAPSKLRELPEDIRVAPGLFTRGVSSTVFVVRPKVRI